MRLRVLGSNGTYPSPGRPCSGYLVEHGTTRIWLDAGPGSFVALWSLIDLSQLSAIVVSHRHPDHSIDLLSAYHAFAFGSHRLTGVRVFAPRQTIESLRGFAGSNGEAEHPFERVFQFVDVDDGDIVEVDDVMIRFARTVHSVDNVACRMEAGGRVLVYTGDTGPSETGPGESWTRLAEGAHLLLCEASLQDASPPFANHLTARQAGAIARGQGVRHLVLTHIPPHLDVSRSVIEAEEAFDRPVDVAVPGGMFQI